jgi:hypothetical protein
MTNTTMAKLGSAAWIDGVEISSMTAGILVTAYLADYYSSEYVALKGGGECVMFDNEDDARAELVRLAPALYAIGGWEDDDEMLDEANAFDFSDIDPESINSMLDEAYETATEIGIALMMVAAGKAIDSSVAAMFPTSVEEGYIELKGWADRVFAFFGIDIDDAETASVLYGLVECVDLPAEV